MFGKKGSKILKLPPFRSCFTLAMTNKLVVIINSLNVPKINKILVYEMKFLVPNYSCLQNPWIGWYRPQMPVLSVPCHQLNLLNPSPHLRTKFLGKPLAGIWSIFHNLYLFFCFPMAISNSKVLDWASSGSAVCISVCLTLLNQMYLQ